MPHCLGSQRLQLWKNPAEAPPMIGLPLGLRVHVPRQIRRRQWLKVDPREFVIFNAGGLFHRTTDFLFFCTTRCVRVRVGGWGCWLVKGKKPTSEWDELWTRPLSGHQKNVCRVSWETARITHPRTKGGGSSVSMGGWCGNSTVKWRQPTDRK